MLFTAGARKRHLLTLAGLFLVAAPVVWFKGMKEYQRGASWLPARRHYQVAQSVKSVIAGGGFGRGLGEGLPPRSTSFLNGIRLRVFDRGRGPGLHRHSFVLLLITVYFATSLKIAHQSRNRSDALVVGLTTMFATQTFINLGMNAGGRAGHGADASLRVLWGLVPRCLFRVGRAHPQRGGSLAAGLLRPGHGRLGGDPRFAAEIGGRRRSIPLGG